MEHAGVVVYTSIFPAVYALHIHQFFVLVHTYVLISPSLSTPLLLSPQVVLWQDQACRS